MKLKNLKTSLLTALIALLAFNVAAFEVGDLAYETCTVDGVTMAKCTGLSAAGKTKNTNNTIGYIQIPSTVSNGSTRYRVYYIGNSAFASTNITGVRINWGVYEIGNFAFKNCTKLTSARIASSVQSLQAEGFAGCTALSTVYWAGFGWGTGRMAGFWPSNSNMTLYINYEQTHSVSEFKNDWFWKVFKNVYYDNFNCSDVNFTDGYGLTIGDTDMQGANTYRNATVTYFDPSKTTINGDTYSVSTSDERMGVYYKWSKIGINALASNSTVKTINLGNATNLNEIHVDAFRNSTALTSFTMPPQYVSFYYGAFWGCSSLTEFKVPSNATGWSTYSGALYNKAGTYLYIVPQGLSGDLYYSSTLQTVGKYSHYGCAKLVNSYLPFGLRKIEEYAFYNCSNLTFVRIPSSVTSLSTSYVFKGIASNTTISCNMSNPPTITASDYFGNNSGMYLRVPYGKKSDYSSAGWTGFKEVNKNGRQAYDIHSDLYYTVTSTAATTVNGSNYNGRCKLVSMGDINGSAGGKTINIPAVITLNGKSYAVTKIGEEAFQNNTSNFTVTGCVNIDTIGYGAFQNQSVTSYPFTHTLKYIQDYAFDGAGFTGTVQIPYGVQKVDYFAFAHGKYSRFVMPHGVSHYGNFCAYTTTLTEFVYNMSGDYNYSNWNLTGVPSTCYIRVPMGYVNHYKQGKLKDRAAYITGGAYDFAYNNAYTGRYYLTITSSSSTTYNGTTYAGTAKYVYHPNIKASTITDTYGWSISEEDRTVSNDKRNYLITELGDSLLAGVTNFGIANNIPGSVKKIAHDALYSASKVSVANLKLPDGLTYIGDYAFNSTKLSGEIKIPSGVTYIGKYAFASMPNLNALYFPSDKPSTLGNTAWSGTTNASNFTVWVQNNVAYKFLNAANGWSSACGDKISVYIKPYATAQMFSAVVPVDLQGSGITGYYASAFDKNNANAQVTLTKANMAPESTGLLLVDLVKNQEYRIKRPTNSVSAPMTNYLVATPSSEVNVYNQTVGYYWKYSEANPYFQRPTSGYNTAVGSAYLKLSSAEASGLDKVYTNLWPHTNQGGVLGDLNGNGLVEVEDVNAAINIILKLKTMADYPGNGDMNGNGMIEVEDVNAMINIILKL